MLESNLTTMWVAIACKYSWRLCLRWRIWTSSSNVCNNHSSELRPAEHDEGYALQINILGIRSVTCFFFVLKESMPSQEIGSQVNQSDRAINFGNFYSKTSTVLLMVKVTFELNNFNPIKRGWTRPWKCTKLAFFIAIMTLFYWKQNKINWKNCHITMSNICLLGKETVDQPTLEQTLHLKRVSVGTLADQ